MQHGTLAGEMIFRYDNFPDHPVPAHHHTHPADADVDGVESGSLGAPFDRFKHEVPERGDHRE